MDCCNHPDKEAQAICVSCGQPFCADCLLKINEKNYCKNCLTNKVEQEMPHSYQPRYQQQQQQQNSDNFPDFASLDFTNIHLAFIALGLFLVSIVIFAFSQGNFYLVLLGILILLASLAVGFYYALGLTQKERQNEKLRR